MVHREGKKGSEVMEMTNKKQRWLVQQAVESLNSNLLAFRVKGQQGPIAKDEDLNTQKISAIWNC